ncbi:hypothetical protein GA707_09640 [Nostocoides sp. F2B08]|uniref:glycosyltransferase n=1 Tax=Nostocoides sp. F2B08 TaxID=2653936 RepID=UPI0012639512|nr:glycosyltransferase [Tetrasphaera sp. F2B08]KAB7744825.1 hypothetical protein GA707_09640 [Tetrasphaera sp. F2B08]
MGTEETTRVVDHVVLTNFSAPRAESVPAPDAELLWYRLGFFFDACLPSVSGQRGADFTWLVWFDDRCEPDFRQEVERIAAGAFTPVWGHRPFNAMSVADVVAGRAHSPYLITTVLDSDDAMARDCLATVRAELGREERLLITFPEGLIIDRTGGVFAARDDSAPVRSLIEARAEGVPPTTVVGVTAEDDVPQRRISRPMWIDVVHEAGRAEMITSRRVHPKVVADRFDIDLAYDQELSGAALLKARRGDFRRLGRNIMRDPRRGALAIPALRSIRSASWMAQGAVNSAADLRARRRGTAGLHVVAGDPDSVVSGDRIAVLAEFSHEDRVRPWALVMAGALAAAGYPCLLVCSRERGSAVTAPDAVPHGVAIVSRANAKYDFGAWAAALDAHPALTQAGHVLLTNDSVIGPLPSDSPGLRATLDRAEASRAQVWAATRGVTGAEHLQSYFLLFNDGALSLPPVRDFFTTLPRTRDRIDLVRAYEHGLTRTLAAASIRTGWGWDHASFGVGPGFNPSLCWHELLDAGFPFVKRRLFTHPRFADQRPLIIQHVRERYGVDLSSGL